TEDHIQFPASAPERAAHLPQLGETRPRARVRWRSVRVEAASGPAFRMSEERHLVASFRQSTHDNIRYALDAAVQSRRDGKIGVNRDGNAHANVSRQVLPSHESPDLRRCSDNGSGARPANQQSLRESSQAWLAGPGGD